MKVMLKLTGIGAYKLFRKQKGIKSDRWTFKELKTTHAASGLTLDSGAKLFYSPVNGYYVTGYHYAGDDVKCYAQFGQIVNL